MDAPPTHSYPVCHTRHHAAGPPRGKPRERERERRKAGRERVDENSWGKVCKVVSPAPALGCHMQWVVSGHTLVVNTVLLLCAACVTASTAGWCRGRRQEEDVSEPPAQLHSVPSRRPQRQRRRRRGGPAEKTL